MPPDVRTDTLDGINAPGDDRTDEVIRNRRILYGLTTLLVCAILGFALLGSVTDVGTTGVSSDKASDSADGYELTVTYPSVSRPGLASSFVIELTHEGGFSEPITLAVDHRYLLIWDENGLNPSPSAETMHGDWLLWEFDPPEGETFRVTLDGRIAPTAQAGRDGRVAVMDANVPVVEVDFHTRIMP